MPHRILPVAIVPGVVPGPAAVAGLYLWNPLSIAAAVGGSPAGLENAAVFAALAGASDLARILDPVHMIPRSDVQQALVSTSCHMSLTISWP